MPSEPAPAYEPPPPDYNGGFFNQAFQNDGANEEDMEQVIKRKTC